MNKVEYENILAFHPGYYISDLIKDLDMTQDEFAKRINITPKNLSDLVNGKASISDRIANNLSLMLGTSIEMWLDMQKKYDQKVLEIERLKAQKQEEEYLSMIDYSYFEKLGVVQSTKDVGERISELFKYLNISSFKVFTKPFFERQFDAEVAKFRKKQCADVRILLNSNIWIQTVINIGRKTETKPYSEKSLRDYLPQIRAMTLQDIADIIPNLCRILSECGVAFVLVPGLKNSGVYGATKWINKDKVVLGMTNRGQYADIFWFSLFHELGHVLQKRIKKTIVDFETSDNINDDEKEADQFARDRLIPPKEYQSFINKRFFSKKEICSFANSIEIHPGIVVGRLQKEGYVHYSHLNMLKQRFVLSHMELC
jgi:HTH-type transcriptional regulator/antitoxin HigA